MLLSDNELRALLPSLQISVPDGFDPFTADEQIRPASIDLRLGDEFWEPRRKLLLDLRRSELLEIEPRRYYRRRRLRPTESITIRPGGMLIARTLERMSVPSDVSGDLVGRSSFARLGLAVTATGNLINPGWHGHIALQLINNGRTTLRLMPGMPLCQIRFFRLSSSPSRPYGSKELGSLYMDDDGGPSYWWRDKRIAKLQRTLVSTSVSLDVQRRIFEIVGKQEPEVLERLEKSAALTRLRDLSNADTFLESFSIREDRRRLRRTVEIRIQQGLFTVAFAVLLLSTRTDMKDYRWYLWVGFVLIFLFSAVGFARQVGDHLGTQELRRLREKLT